MAHPAGAEEEPPLLQLAGDDGVGLLEEQPGVGADALVVGAVQPHGVDDGEAVLHPQREVVLAERDRGVHQAGAVVGGHEVAEQDGVPARAVLAARDVVEGRLVADAVERGPREAVEHLGARVLPEHPLDERLGEDDDLLAGPDARVGQLGVDGDRGVGDERPRRGGPDEQLVARNDGARALRHAEAHVDRRVDDVPVALGDLVRRERRAAARAVRDHLVALVHQVLVPDLPERPPDRVDVARVERAVGVVEVEPEADALGEAIPVLEVGEDRLAALPVERLDAVGLDVRLALEPERLLDLDLDGQPVGVPAALARDVVAAHRLVAREDVLEDAGQDVMGARLPVRGRRPLVEDELRTALPEAHRLGEDVAVAPALEHLLLERGEGLVRVDGTAGHGGRAL